MGTWGKTMKTKETFVVNPGVARESRTRRWTWDCLSPEACVRQGPGLGPNGRGGLCRTGDGDEARCRAQALGLH